MAEINASIPLGVTAPQQQDPINTVAKAYELKDMILKDKQQEQQLKTQSELKSIFSDPTTDTSTPEGQQKLIKRVASIDPAQALQLQKDYSTVDLQKAQTSKALAGVASEKFDQIKKASDLTNSAFSYLDNLAQGPQGKDKVFMNQAFQQQVQHLKDQGVITPEMAKQIPQQYDPNWVHATAMQDKDHANLINQEAERREKAFKDNADIRQGQQRIGIEAENASTNRARLGYEENQPKSDIGKINADFASGKMSPDEHTAAIAKAEKTPGTTGGAMAANYTSNMVSASSTARGSIERFQSFGGKTNPSFTLAAQGGHNGFKQDFIEKVVKGKLPSEQQKQFDSNVGGLAIAAGRVFNDGQRPSQTTIDEIEKKLSPQPDDTAETMNYRYGAMGQDVINELKGRRAISSPDQQKNIDDEIKQWEPIANLAQSGGNPSGSAEKAEQTRTGSAPDYSNLWN
jgi:hypothetical protein